jgi:hypothetical protein
MCGRLFLRFIFLVTADAGGIVHTGEVKVYVCLQGKLQYLNEWRISLPTMSADHCHYEAGQVQPYDKVNKVIRLQSLCITYTQT